MNKSFFIGALGAHQQQKSMGVTGNNIANVNTYGFKAEKSRFGNLLYQNVRAVDQEDVKSGVGTRMVAADTLHHSGGAADTGRGQDYMIEGDGFFALKDVGTGEISLTRNGAFMMASLKNDAGELEYYLSDGCGRFVLDQNSELIPMSRELMDEVMPVGIFDCDNYNGMLHLEDTRFVPVPKNGPLKAGTGKLISRALERSNVDLAQEMTNMIEQQRAYSMALKMMMTSDEIETTINNLRS